MESSGGFLGPIRPRCNLGSFHPVCMNAIKCHGSLISFFHDLFSTPFEGHVSQRNSSPTPHPLCSPFRFYPTVPHPSCPSCATPSPKLCKPPPSTNQEHRTQHSNHHTQESPRTDFAAQLISPQFPSFIV